jgi:hypothetical protein
MLLSKQQKQHARTELKRLGFSLHPVTKTITGNGPSPEGL